MLGRNGSSASPFESRPAEGVSLRASRVVVQESTITSPYSQFWPVLIWVLSFVSGLMIVKNVVCGTEFAEPADRQIQRFLGAASAKGSNCVVLHWLWWNCIMDPVTSHLMLSVLTLAVWEDKGLQPIRLTDNLPEASTRCQSGTFSPATVFRVRLALPIFLHPERELRLRPGRFLAGGPPRAAQERIWNTKLPENPVLTLRLSEPCGLYVCFRTR